MEDKRFIEESFPVKEVSEESAREKNIRHSHISTLHIWWARRPLASSRATNYAALIPAPKDQTEWDKKRQFIIDLCKWENSNNRHLIEKARKDILEANGGKPPKALDPFAGGGAIPLEALRLGCETYAGEYNPVAILILKCTLEYPQKYGKPKETSKDWDFLKESMKNPLVEDVRKWGNWVLEKAKKEIGRFYPNDPDGSIPVGYIWAKTIPCQNPSCQAEIPLMRQFWLAKKDKKEIALKTYVENRSVEFEIVGQNKPFPKNLDSSTGTVKGSVAHCLVCGSTVDANRTRKLFQEDKARGKMVVVVLHYPKKKGKYYRIATKKDLEIFEEAEKYLKKKREKLMEEWGIDPVPDEPTPEGKGRGAERAFSIRNYGLNTWGDLFNCRQKLALIIFVEKIRLAHKKMIEEGYDEEYTKAVVSYLGLTFNRMAMSHNSLTQWQVGYEKMGNMFSRQTLSMVWDYAEPNPCGNTVRSWTELFKDTINVIFHCSQVVGVQTQLPTVFQSSATEVPYPDNFFDVIFTDPPYYDNVPYSYLSDFFYVWLKRTIGDLYPELFSTPLTPKSKEIVAYTNNKTWEEAKTFFEENLKKAFQEIYRVLKPNGIATIVYAHKSTPGWETLINSLLDSDVVITASWPIHTERKTRARAQESAALASSIYFVARKTKKEEKGWYNEVKEEIKKYLYKKLERLWEEQISGADFFVAGIGSAIEIFGKYEKVMDYEGNVIRADKLLDFVRHVVTDYAVRQILHNGIAGELSPLTKFYILWRWTYQDVRVPFDDARKLAQSSGIDLSKEWNKGFIRKEKEFIRVLGPHERRIKEMKGSNELIDVIHHSVILWKEGKREEMKKVLQESGWGSKDAFYRVADTISKTMAQKETKENQLLDGFLSGKKQILSEVTKVKQKQLDLFINKGREGK
jgi:putative DNA methylase